MAPFLQRAIKFSLTYPQCPLEKQVVADLFEVLFPNQIQWIVIAQEHHAAVEGELERALHLHIGLRFIAQKSFTRADWADLVEHRNIRIDEPAIVYHGNYQTMRNQRAWLTYLSKEDPQPLAIGIDLSAAVQHSGNAVAIIAALVKDGKNLEEIDRTYPSFVLTHKRKIEEYISFHRELVEQPQLQQTCRGLWIFGPSGSGKSHLAREMYPDAFQKTANKWWDTYAGESSVILDDLSKKGANCLGYYLKRWMDRFPCPRAEIKGGTVKLNFSNFVVTSQYSIESIFDDHEDIVAITRRCKIIMFNGPRDYHVVDPALL